MEHFQLSPDCRSRKDIPKMLQAMGLRGEGAEIGVRDGIYAKTILTGWECSKLHVVDPWCELPIEEYQDDRAFDPESYERCLRRLAEFGDRVVWHRCKSRDATFMFGGLLDNWLEFVYVDANHSYPYVVSDLAEWWCTLTLGGVLAGHDIMSLKYPGVTQAVLEFCQERRLTCYLVPEETNETGEQVVDASWYILKGER